MKQIPFALEDALIGDILEGHVLVFDPFTKTIRVQLADGDISSHRMDVYDGLVPSVLFGREDLTSKAVIALDCVIGAALGVTLAYEASASIAAGSREREDGRIHPGYRKLAKAMARYNRALLALVPWRVFQRELRERAPISDAY